MQLRLSNFTSLVCSVCLAAPLAAQTPAGDQSQVPVIKANARTVVVDVVVTRGNDDPVPGLHQQDFQVLEDGKPQAIDFFEEHEAKTLPNDAIKPPLELPANVYSNIPPAPQSDSVNVLLLDTLNTEKADQPVVRDQIRTFLKGMDPGTRVAIFTLGSEFRFVQGFTSDASLLLAALNNKKNGAETAKDPSFHSRSDEADDVEERRAMAAVAAMVGGNAGEMLVGGLQAAQTEASSYGYAKRVSMTLDALESIARYLAGVPGRKNLIWFAGSFPIAVFPTTSQQQQMAQIHGNLDRVKKTANLLTTAKVAVYPVNGGGLSINHPMEADNTEASAFGGAPAQNFAAEGGSRIDTIAAMEQLATDTGGKAYYNTNDLHGAIQHAVADGSHFYTVAYTPANSHMDGKFRKIEVRLATGRYTLAYRHGYNADDTHPVEAKQQDDPLHPLLGRGMPAATELTYYVRVIPVSPQPAPSAARAGQNSKLTGPLTRYKADFRISAADIAFKPANGGNRSGNIHAGMIAYDRDGNSVNWVGIVQNMDVNPAQFDAIQKNGVPVHMEIDLPDKDLYLETGVYDWNTGKAGTMEIPLHPASAAPAAVTGR
jgi:VWFA-related protein